MSDTHPVEDPLPRVRPSEIPGLLVVSLDVRGDARGWFKENWQRAKLVARGLPDFGPVQHNVSFNTSVGTTRGLHAEPWDKLVSVLSGRVYGAWVDLRSGPGFGRRVSLELDETTAVFVPRGVANGFQTLQEATVYSYLVNEHWSAEATSRYAYCNLADPDLAIAWPIPLERAEMSEADRHHPLLRDVAAVPAAGRVVIVGGTGQLGRALRAALPEATVLTRAEVDLADPASVAAGPWREADVVINAAAYTRVDEAETPEGRRLAWQTNAAGPAALAELAREHRFTLVHVSSDYVFDGTRSPHAEDEPPSPLGVYGQSKAAGDLAVAQAPQHYLVRTSWVIGEGANFVATMERLARDGRQVSVVDDQVGRLTHTDNLAAGILHLLEHRAPYGTYNLSDGGDPVTWADIARAVFRRCGRSDADVTGVSSATYFAGRDAAPRPADSVLDLAKITATGYRVPTLPA